VLTDQRERSFHRRLLH